MYAGLGDFINYMSALPIEFEVKRVMLTKIIERILVIRKGTTGYGDS